jgi:UDP-N-acetylmuramoyl-L-alanyl-D-glutamate--2,6-diaminopimelate ligase
MALSVGRLCEPWPELVLEGSRDVPIAVVTGDSRVSGPGVLFVAVPGSQRDGHDFVPAAVAAGCAAVAVAAEHRARFALDTTAERPAAVITAPRTQGLAGRLARELMGRPDESLTVAGVTGTNGKTTVAFLLQHLLDNLVGPCGLVGTVRYETGGPPQPASLTTPDGPTLFGLLEQMVVRGRRAAALEISSHALDQERVPDLALDVAVLTNLSRDHLDYHRDLDAYLQAKARILELVRPARGREKAPGAVALNVADPAFAALDLRGLRVVRYAAVQAGRAEGPIDLRVTRSHLTLEGTRLTLSHGGSEVELSSPLVGRFNVENLTAALAAGLALGLPAADCARALAGVEQVPGRLERFALPAGGLAVVDYAHTPEALAAVLATCRELTTGRLLAVFGCGGDRDRGKRPLMGAAVARGADLAWITSDNPRSEDPQAICDAVEAGFLAEPAGRARECHKVVDRATAIGEALAAAGAEDIVLVAGKGHEDYQIVGASRRHLDDRELIRDWIAGRVHRG